MLIPDRLSIPLLTVLVRDHSMRIVAAGHPAVALVMLPEAAAESSTSDSRGAMLQTGTELAAFLLAMVAVGRVLLPRLLRLVAASDYCGS